MKIKLIHCELLSNTYRGECLVTLERTDGFIWKSIQRFQVRGSLGDWYHYPSGVECSYDLSCRVNKGVRIIGEELERLERVREWDQK